MPDTTVLGLGYEGDTVPECIEGMCFIVQNDVGPVCFHPTFGDWTQICVVKAHSVGHPSEQTNISREQECLI